MTYNAVMNGRDLKRASALSMSAMGPQMMASGAIGDYEAGTEVASVTELPNGLASAEVRFTEHGMLDLRALAGATGGSDGGEAAIPAEGLEPLIFTSAAECTFRLSRENGEIVIILAACRTDTTM
jgi:hypothetical protein